LGVPAYHDVSSRADLANCHVFAAVLEEKSAALHALGTFAECVSASFGPYIEESLKMVVQLVDYFHDTVRDEAYTALAALLKATTVVYPAGATGILTSFQHTDVQKLPFIEESRNITSFQPCQAD